jgi:hypothetical protein
MRADADGPRSNTTFFAHFGWLEEEVDTALGPIAQPIETRQKARSAKTLLYSIKQGVEAHQVGEAAHSVL